MNSNKVHVCPVDSRKFATKQALDQHRRDAHPASTPASSRGRNRRPRAAGANRRTAGQTGAAVAMSSRARLSGGFSNRSRSIDIFASTAVDIAKAKVGLVLAHLVISPRLFEGTRLGQLATLWSRWRPVSFNFTIQTTLPTIAGGQITAAWSADDAELLPNNDIAMVRKLGSMRPCVIKHGWEVLNISVTAESVQKWLYTDNRQDDSKHGCLWVVLTGSPSVSSGSFQTTVQCDWVVDFEAPDIPTAAEGAIIEADDGYFPYYTTGTSHLGISDRLTAEENSNGGYASIVRFSRAQTDVVYVPSHGKITYFDSAGAEKEVGAAVRMKEVADPFFWFFATTADAQEYVKSGSVSKILKYVKAGNWTKDPVNPSFKENTTVTLGEVMFTNSRPTWTVSARGLLPFVNQTGFQGLVKRVSTGFSAIVDDLESRPYGTVTSPIVVIPPPIEVESAASSVSNLSIIDSPAVQLNG